MKSTKIRIILAGLVLIVVSLSFTSLSHAKIDPKTVVGLWLFDEGSGDVAKDSSGKGNDGTLMGKPKWVKGKYGTALQFNGSNYVSVPPTDSLNMNKEITVLFWFRTDKKMSVFEDRQAVVGKHYLEYEVGIYPAGMIHTYTNDGTVANYDEGINATMAGKLPEGDADWDTKKWYHIAWTLEKLHEIAYVNGVVIGEFNKPHEGTKPGAHTLEIGRRQGGSLAFEGDVDEVAVLNVPLKAADIQAVFKNGLEVECGLVKAVAPAGKITSTWADIKSQ